MPLVRPSAHEELGRARTRGVAQLQSNLNGEAEPRLTSGGEAGMIVPYSIMRALSNNARLNNSMIRALVPIMRALITSMIRALITSIIRALITFGQSPSTLQLCAQSFVDDFGVGFALRRFDHLAHKETNQGFFAGAIAGDLIRVCSDDVFD